MIMKTVMCLIVLGASLVGCTSEQLKKTINPETMQTQSIQETETQKIDVKTCLTTDGLRRIQDGSAFAAPIRVTVNQMVWTCLELKKYGEVDMAEENVSSDAVRQLGQQILLSLMSSNSAFSKANAESNQ